MFMLTGSDPFSPDDSVEGLEGNEPSETSGNFPSNSEPHLPTTQSGRVVRPVDYYGYGEQN